MDNTNIHKVPCITTNNAINSDDSNYNTSEDQNNTDIPYIH